MGKTIVVAITGASGSLYGIRLLKALLEGGHRVHLVVSKAGVQVLSHEAGYTGGSFLEYLKGFGHVPHGESELQVHDPDDFFTPPASGSFRHDGMVIAPCSMKTLAQVASGLAGNLITRAADVCLKEGFPLVLMPREAPLSVIHMENMLKLGRAGAVIMPACPSLYSKPETLEDLADTLTARILDRLAISQDLVRPWGS